MKNKMITQRIICPTCNGTGFFNITIDFPSSNSLLGKIKLLAKKGLSLRKIGAMTGIKNAATVAYYLKKSAK